MYEDWHAGRTADVRVGRLRDVEQARSYFLPLKSLTGFGNLGHQVWRRLEIPIGIDDMSVSEVGEVARLVETDFHVW